MTVNEFMKKHGVSRRTVYNWIKSDEIEAKKERGKWHISDDTDVPLDDTDAKQDGKDELIEQLRSENEYLREELSQTNGTIADMQQRHDTIVMSLSNQVDRQQKMLEDMRNRSLWFRVRTALGFASA